MEQYFFSGLLIATLVFTFFIFRPFWVVLVLAVCFAVVLYPVYLQFKRSRMPDALASLVTVILFALVLLGPVLGIGVMVFNQSQNVYQKVAQSENSLTFITSAERAVNRFLPVEVNFDAKEKSREFISYVSDNIAKIFKATISAFVSFILLLLAMFYLLKDGEKWRGAILLLSPLSSENNEKIISRLSQSISGVIKGYLFVAVIQGTLMGLGLWFFGVPDPALWGLVAAAASLLPTIGTGLVSVPAIIYLFLSGSTGLAIGLLVWATVAVGLVDNFLSPYVISSKVNIPPLLVLFSILGGISLLGPVGILIGPLAVSLLYALIGIYRNEWKDAK